MIKNIRHIFVKGLYSLLPIVVTLYLVFFLFRFMDHFFGTYIEQLFKRSIPGIGILASIVLVFLMGFFVSNVMGKKLLHWGERMIQKIPIVPKVYFGIKQIIDAFSLQGKQVFSRVVLVEYPRKGTYAVGFLTGACGGEVQQKTASNLINVFIPTTPNPTSGMLILVPQEEIIYLDMSVEDGLKMIVSAGLVVPVEHKQLAGIDYENG